MNDHISVDNFCNDKFNKNGIYNPKRLKYHSTSCLINYKNVFGFPYNTSYNYINTSKLYNKTFKELENVSVRKNKHKKQLHEILTPKEKTERCIFVNRDNNACKNILYLGKYFLEHQIRPIEFCQKPKEKKVIIKNKN